LVPFAVGAILASIRSMLPDLERSGVRMTAGHEIVRSGDRYALIGDFRIADAMSVCRFFREHTSAPHGRRLDIDLSQAPIVDGAIMSLLVELRATLSSQGILSDIVGASERLQAIVHLYGGDEPSQAPPAKVQEGAVRRLGRAVEGLFDSLQALAVFLGGLVAALGRTVRWPASLNWCSFPSLVVRAGADGVPIVLLLNFLVGFVMAFQSAHQLKLYGANVYVADVVGISITRELAPLMTAIIMSGRSGAAYAAELGTMRVSEEIDALRTMGFAPVPYLILPRMAALAAVAPVLALLGDIVGVIGGMAVGITSLDVSARGYLAELRTAVAPSDVWTGLVKSMVFGAAIGFIGCEQGVSTSGSAAGVGRSTTTTVVACLFTIVLIDTVFTILFRTFVR
jgi:phospholipid/cholesterol/gamma-HCH transport system permease protein